MHTDLFSILDSVDSTNNYAIEKIKQGFGINGKAWFANDQWGGKGQRGKTWESEPGKNIILSITSKPNPLFAENPFYFSALVAATCRNFIAGLTSTPVKIKWPNDLYINDRKAGGVLIENIYKGNRWEWAVIGIGININQIEFGSENNKTSIFKESKIVYDPLTLAKRLHEEVLLAFKNITNKTLSYGLIELNEYLYKRDEDVCFTTSKNKIISKIKAVNKLGQLVSIKNGEEIVFNVGDVIFNFEKW